MIRVNLLPVPRTGSRWVLNGRVVIVHSVFTSTYGFNVTPRTLVRPRYRGSRTPFDTYELTVFLRELRPIRKISPPTSPPLLKYRDYRPRS